MPTLYGLEQNDPVRIKLERDMFAEAIAKMGVESGLLSPDAILEGPHLIMTCQDMVISAKAAFESAKEVVKVGNRLVGDLLGNPETRTD